MQLSFIPWDPKPQSKNGRLLMNIDCSEWVRPVLWGYHSVQKNINKN